MKSEEKAKASRQSAATERSFGDMVVANSFYEQNDERVPYGESNGKVDRSNDQQIGKHLSNFATIAIIMGTTVVVAILMAVGYTIINDSNSHDKFNDPQCGTGPRPGKYYNDDSYRNKLNEYDTDESELEPDNSDYEDEDNTSSDRDTDKDDRILNSDSNQPAIEDTVTIIGKLTKQPIAMNLRITTDNRASAPLEDVTLQRIDGGWYIKSSNQLSLLTIRLNNEIVPVRDNRTSIYVMYDENGNVYTR